MKYLRFLKICLRSPKRSLKKNPGRTYQLHMILKISVAGECPVAQPWLRACCNRLSLLQKCFKSTFSQTYLFYQITVKMFSEWGKHFQTFCWLGPQIFKKV